MDTSPERAYLVFGWVMIARPPVARRVSTHCGTSVPPMITLSSSPRASAALVVELDVLEVDRTSRIGQRGDHRRAQGTGTVEDLDRPDRDAVVLHPVGRRQPDLATHGLPSERERDVGVDVLHAF